VDVEADAADPVDGEGDNEPESSTAEGSALESESGEAAAGSDLLGPADAPS
jgi:hypothetical protein